MKRGRGGFCFIWTLLTGLGPLVPALKVGISLSQTGFLRNMVGFVEELPEYARASYVNQSVDGQLLEWPCFWCQRVVETLMVWQRRATDLQLEFTIMDDGGNFSRAMENYALMTADPSVDLLFGPCLGTWNAYAANVVTGNKVLVQWSITYQRYMGGYRTEVCPYCNYKWFRETDWVDSQSYGNQTDFLFSRRDVSIPTGNRTVTNPALEFDWESNNKIALSNSIYYALYGIKTAVESELEPGRDAVWTFAFFEDMYSGAGRYSCRNYKAAVDHWGNATTTLIPLKVKGLVWNPLSLDGISADVLVLCGTSSLLGEFLIQASAVHLAFKALFLELPAGVGKIFGYGSFLVNYLVETIPIPTVLPNTVDPVFGSLEDFAAELKDVPDIAALQISSCASILTQAIRQEGGFSNAIVPVLKQPLFMTLLGRMGEGTYAFRQFLPSNAPALVYQNHSLPLVPGPLNSNGILVSATVAAMCEGGQYSTSLMCEGPVLKQIAYPMPFRQELFQQSHLCPEGTSLTSLQCRPCEPGYFRQDGMLHCQACSAGTYVDVSGAATCLDCPSDSLSCSTSSTPQLKPGFFTFTGDYAFLSNNSGTPAIPDFVFGFEGTYNTSAMPQVAKSVKASGLKACSQNCYFTNDCIGFSYEPLSKDCVLAQEEVRGLEQIPGNRSLFYWRQSMLEELNLSHLNPSVSGQFPVTSFGLEYGKCFVPTPCAGDTSCTQALNTGLYCAQCSEGSSFASLFPASRMCTKCPNVVLMQVRIVVILLLMFLLVLGTLRAAKSVAKGSLSLTVPALKVLYHYCIIVGLIFDMNFFLVSEIYGLIVRLPYEFMLRPWLMIQVECLPLVLNLPTDGYSGDALSIHLQQQFALYFLVAICIFVLLESAVLIVQRLITFCSVKLPDFNQENMSALQPMKSNSNVKNTETDAEPRSPRSPRDGAWSPRSPRGRAESGMSLTTRSEEVADFRSQSKQTSVSQRMTSATYGRMLGRFYWMHLEFEICGHVRTFIRRFTVIIFFLVPVYLRSLVIPWRCVPLGSNGYSVNVEYVGLFCDTDEAAELRYEVRFTAVIIALPVVMLLLILATTRTRKHEPTMEALAFVTAGFKDGQRWWCVMLEGRLALVFFLMTVLEASQLRNLLLLALSTIYCLAELRVNPWNSAHNLVLSKASLTLNLSILLMTILGAWIRGMTGIQVRIRNLVVIFLTIPTVLCSVYGNATLILNLLSEVFFGKMLALLKAGAITGPWTKVAFYVNNWLCGNLFEMHFMKSGDRYALDHSQLNTFERTQLLSMLVELIQGCLARHGKFRMRMVEVMLIMGFERAMQVRRGLLNVNFHEHGHALHSLTPIGFPKVLSPDPDLAPLMELKVTLAELQDALETLMQDIHAGDPEIIIRSTVFTGAVEEKKHEGHHPRQQILVWDEQVQLQDIESKVLHSSGSVDAEEQAVGTEAVIAQETPAELLRRLTRLLEDQLLRYQSEVDLAVKEFKDEMVKALGQKRLADAQERRSRIELAEATLNEYSDLPKPSEGIEELGQEAVLSSLKIRQATSAAKEFLSKMKAWEEASDSYFTKVFEMIPKVCSGEDMKINGKKQWERELRDARAACLRCHEQLQRAVKACHGDAVSSREAPSDSKL